MFTINKETFQSEGNMLQFYTSIERQVVTFFVASDKKYWSAQVH